MVPFQSHTSLNDLAKKRKWEEPTSTPPTLLNSMFDIELHLETPLPSDWQRCLDIQSGKIHFYNTTTQKRTWKDPRDKLDKDEEEEEEEDDNDMSLDLELNLTCESLDKNNNNQTTQGGRRAVNNGSSAVMVAAVCIKCHLLVMLSKSSPECPNCKFMNSPPEQTPPAILKCRRHLSW
ncbi:hypothetical protein SDJN02_07968, partial [Cucurbita argyrosperma subsp. argyrosperma]